METYEFVVALEVKFIPAYKMASIFIIPLMDISISDLYCNIHSYFKLVSLKSTYGHLRNKVDFQMKLSQAVKPQRNGENRRGNFIFASCSFLNELSILLDCI